MNKSYLGLNSIFLFQNHRIQVRKFYSFGSLLSGRVWSTSSAGKYRFGFNGKEAISEINADGGSYDYGERIYDGKLGRWLSLDPLAHKYPDNGPYNFTMDNPILFIDPDGNVVTIKDVASYKAILGTLTQSEINRIVINEKGEINILTDKKGSTNLENLRILVDSKTNHNIMTSRTYESADGKESLKDKTNGRTLFPESEATEMGLPKNVASPDDDVYIILNPIGADDESLVAVVAHEAYGHAVLGEKRRKGEKVNPLHGKRDKYGKDTNKDLNKQGWGAVSAARVNYRNNLKSKVWRKALDKAVKDFVAKVK